MNVQKSECPYLIPNYHFIFFEVHIFEVEMLGFSLNYYTSTHLFSPVIRGFVFSLKNLNSDLVEG